MFTVWVFWYSGVHRLQNRQFIYKHLCKILKPGPPMQSFCPQQRQTLQRGRLWHGTAGRQNIRRKVKGKEEISSQRTGSGDTSLLPPDEGHPQQFTAWLFPTLTEQKGGMCKIFIFMLCFLHAACTFPNKEQGTQMSGRICFARTHLKLFQLGGGHSTCCLGRRTYTDLGIHIWIASG